MTKPKKIVVVRYRFIGDTLLTIPFLRALRRRNPEAEIHFLTGDDAFSLLEHCPYVNEVIPFEPRKLGFWNAVNLMKRQNYDCAYVLKRSFSSALMMRLARIPERIGFDTDNRGFFLTQRVPYRPAEKHEAECFLDLLDANASSTDLTLETWIPEEVFQRVMGLLSPQAGPRVVLHATSTNMAKSWPLSHFQSLAEMLVNQYGAQLYCLGTPGDSETYEKLNKQLSPTAQGAFHNLCGKTAVLESLALLKQMQLVIANDSGMVHMAAAAGTPVVAIFGPMDPQQWRPLSENATVLTHPHLTCRPCRMKITCNHQYPCLTEISPERVLDACKPYLTS